MKFRHIEVLDLVALMGPNLYARQPCIKWTIDLGELEERPSNTIPQFPDRLERLVPSLRSHHCSEGVEGGFLQRLHDGTWMGHIIEHVALELQNLAGADASFGKTRSAGRRGVYNVVYECEERETGIEFGRTAIRLVEALIDGEDFDVAHAVSDLRSMRSARLLGPSTRAIVDAATRRGIPHIRIDDFNYVQLGYGAQARRIQATTTSLTGFHGVEVAGDKDLAKSILRFHGIPVPEGIATADFNEALDFAREISWPVVVKPLDASQGRGILTDIRSTEQFTRAFDDAKKLRDTVVVEQHIAGSDFRLLVIGYRFVAAAQRIPARVVGDGVRTIRELIDLENADPRRGEGHEKILTRIEVDQAMIDFLYVRGLTLDSIPEKGVRIYVKTTANLSTGGFSVDVTDKVHPSNVRLAERITRLVGLDIAGIDVVSPRIDIPIQEAHGAVVEVNAAPGFRMHVAPTEGKPRPVGEAVVDMLFPPGVESRIPIVTITGTNGKTTTARLCAHIAKQAGNRVGLTTTDGIYVNNELITAGDCTGPKSASVILRDPTVDFAVLETARGGILRAGLAFDQSDVAIVTNIASDHLGMRDVNTIEDLARVKAVTVETVKPSGYAVLNAEDGMTELIESRARCRIALFSLDPQHQRFRSHIAAGGVGVTLEDEVIVLWENGVRIPISDVTHVPLTFEGRATFNIANALAAVAGSFAAGIGVDDIRIAIRTFFPSVTQTPGRANFIDIGEVKVYVDYGHNAHGLAATSEFLRSMKTRKLIAVFGMPGDRRDVDIAEATKVIARHFDVVVIREDVDRRARAEREVAGLIRRGLAAVGFDETRIFVELVERDAVRFALEIAKEGDIIAYFPEHAAEGLEIVERLRESRRRSNQAAREDRESPRA